MSTYVEAERVNARDQVDCVQSDVKSATIDPGDLLRVIKSSLSKTVLQEHSRQSASKGGMLTTPTLSAECLTCYDRTTQGCANASSTYGGSSEESAASDRPSVEELQSEASMVASPMVDLSEEVSSSRMEEGEKVTQRENDAHWILRFLGYLAGVAGGQIRTEGTIGWEVLRISLKVIFGVLSVLLTIILTPLLLYDSFGHIYFWTRSLHESFQNYISKSAEFSEEYLRGVKSKSGPSGDETILKIHSPSRFAEDGFESARWDTVLWRGENPISDGAFVGYVIALICLFHPSEVWHCFAHLRRFRRFLSLCPPHFPISPNDDIFRYDFKENRFQLSMLFMLESISFEEVCEAFRRRWIQWEAKTRAVASRKWGKCCWRVLDDNEFKLENHIIRKKVNLSETSVAQVVSEMGTAQMDAKIPQWQVWVLETTAAVETPKSSLERTAGATASDVNKMSYVCGKWHHVYSDGVGMMTSIVSRLGDNGVSTAHLPEQYRRKVPWWQVFLYYFYHSLRASTEVLEHFLFNAYAVRPYTAIMQVGDEDGSIRLPLQLTGRKHYSRPAVISLNEINDVRRGVMSSLAASKTPLKGGKPTVNDIFSYCLCSSWAQLQNPKRLQEIVRAALAIPILPSTEEWIDRIAAHPNYTEPKWLSLIIPMMCRTSVPTRMDNFTSLVPARLPLPKIVDDYCNADAERLAVLQDILRIKESIDLLKARNSRTIMFLITCAICKALPERLAFDYHTRMYRNTQFCSTNVAAPPIDAKFFGRIVHGLFFWPAVPSFATGGSSVVSLGDRFQMLTILDEAELLPAVIVASRLLQDFGMEMNETIRERLLVKMADILTDLVQQEFKKLSELFGEPKEKADETQKGREDTGSETAESGESSVNYACSSPASNLCA